MLSEKEKVERKAKRQLEKTIARENSIVASHKAQKPVKELTITIEWKKSRVWGHNPHAEAKVLFHDSSFCSKGGYTCSGCGYDKESTVISAIFNDFLRYKLYTEISGKAPYGCYYHNGNAPEKNYTDHNGNVVYYLEKPRYDGAVGTSCYYNIAEFIGGKFEHVASGKTFDVYKYTDNQ